MLINSEVQSLEDLRPGDLMLGPIGGAVGVGVALGQLMLGEGFRVGKRSIRHAGIVTQASRRLEPGATHEGMVYPTGVITAPKLAQAMPSGAEEIDMRQESHWTQRHAYIRLPEDYPGQAQDAAAVAQLMVREGVGYSFLSYPALALWRFGVSTPRLEGWIDRRRPAVPIAWPSGRQDTVTGHLGVALPCEAICSVLIDQAWSLAGKRVMEDVARQCVTPGHLAIQLSQREGVLWTLPTPVL